MHKNLDFLNDFISDIPVGIARSNSLGKESNQFNQYFFDMFGWDQSDIDTIEKWFTNAYPNEVYRKEMIKLWTRMVEDTENHKKTFSYPVRVKVRCKNGNDKWCEARYYRKENYNYGIFTDISDQVLNEEDLKSTNLHYKALLSSTGDGYWSTDINGFLLDVNEAACEMLGYSNEEMLGKHISSIEVMQDEDEIKANIAAIIEKGHKRFETKHRHKDESVIDVEVSASYFDIDGGTFFALVRDVSHRKMYQEFSSLRLKLSTLVHEDTSKENLLQTALDIMEDLTDSEIGFFHFVDKDQENVSLQVWSTNTLEKMCFAEGQSFHYPISEAGVWVDCIHQNKSIIYNDYEALTHKKGLPEGHAPLKRFITVPIYRYESIVAIIGVGNRSSNYNQKHVELVEQMADTTYEYYERLYAESQVEYMAYYDTLTGLPNRQLFFDRMAQARALTLRNEQFLAVCFLDLDKFKPVNDLYGHHIGDALLQKLAERFINTLREGDTIARFGGDEFALLLTGIESVNKAEETLNRIWYMVNTPFEIEEHRIHVSCSIGATIYPTDDSDPDTLLRHADQAMYQAKEDETMNLVIYEAVENIHKKEEEELVEAFNNGLLNGNALLHLQPKINLNDGSIIGFEALIRWNHPEKGMLYPGAFLPAIENTPIEFKLGEWVVEKAIKILKSWHENEMYYTLSVNISPHQIQLNGFAEYLKNLLGKYPKGLVKYLELEILEVAAISDIKSVVNVMNICAELGVQFSLDDFGTGYSSLTHFHRLPINILKIDQNFVKDMLDEQADLDIVEGVLILAKALKRPVVAEGVETLEIALMLKYFGCDYAQGYGIAKPMPLENVKPWIKTWNDSNSWDTILEHKKLAESDDINVAIFSHKRWIDEVVSFVDNPNEDMSILSDSSCIFERWYKGVGRDRHGLKESYAFIQAKHHKVHETASKIMNLLLEKKLNQARSMISILFADEEDLVDLLIKMDQQS